MVVFIICYLINPTIACGQSATASANEQPFFNEDFWQKVTIAIVAAILSFVSSYLMFRTSERRKPRAQISFSIDTSSALGPFTDDLSEATQVLFRGTVVKHLYQVKCALRNTGNVLIRKEEIRFAFPEETRILEFCATPEPEKEIGMKVDPEYNNHVNDRRVVIDYLPKQRVLNFCFVVDGERPDLTPYPKNETEEVDFIEGELRQVRYDEDVIRRFLIIVILLWSVPETAHIIPFYQLANPVAALVEIILVGFLIPLVPRASQILAHRILRLRSEVSHTNITSRGDVIISGESPPVQTQVSDQVLLVE